MIMRDTRSLATPQEVAEFLQKPTGTLRQWRHLGIGPQYLKIGRDVRYRWEAVERWLDGQKPAAA
jgi:hypothetical protein